ncbi:nitrilase-related carbon-nitrogen hydrolase [Clostridium sp.]|uniref:nitrilase-related carbon-nitrogen hydrolase n=1 Tax=Clostridium sp. TaxID=1506 RepID=UPI002FC97ECB
MKIALAQSNIIWEDKKSNLNIVEAFIKQASKEKVDLILFPEMSLTGFTTEVEKCGEPSVLNSLDNESITSNLKLECEGNNSTLGNSNISANNNINTINKVKALAVKFSINIGIGYIEKQLESLKGKNNYVLISKTGAILSNYSKIHPFTFGKESSHYSGGDTIKTAWINEFNICTFICYDLRFPEIFQIASKKAELITVAANWPSSRKEHWITLLKARAIENQCYIAGINRVGSGDGLDYSGNSLIIDPMGNVVSSALDGMEGLIIGELDLDLVKSLREKFPLKNDRRENLYTELNKDILESIH